MDTRVENFEDLAARGQLWLVEYESSRWAGASDYLVAVGSSEEGVRCSAEVESYMEDAMRELYSDEDEDEEFEDCAYSIVSVDPFGPEHEAWQWFKNPTQSTFYPVVYA